MSNGMKIPEDILLIDKPIGITSFDVIRQLRKRLHIKKMGHAGTLDPLASGLMIIGVDTGTKKLTEFIKLPKEYIAEIRVGERRTTGDMDGTVLETADVPELDERGITKVLENMIGTLTLPVSAYSAIKKGGVPMYKRARKAEKLGEIIEHTPERNMEVIEAEYLSHECLPANETQTGRCVVHVRFSVGSGTYIRSLAEEFGKRLGYPATVQNLRRTKIGTFSIRDAEAL